MPLTRWAAAYEAVRDEEPGAIAETSIVLTKSATGWLRLAGESDRGLTRCVASDRPLWSTTYSPAPGVARLRNTHPNGEPSYFSFDAIATLFPSV